MQNQELVEACQDKDALLSTSLDTIDAGFIEACSHLDIIATFAVGFDNIDVAAATNRNIVIGNTPGVLTDATADVAFGLMIAVARKMFHVHKSIEKGDWKYFIPLKNLGQDLKGKTLGIFGLGGIGYEMARRCRAAYDMEIIYHNRTRNAKAEQDLDATYVDFDKLLADSDVLSVHASLNKATQEIFNQHAFARMKDSAIFINTARGGLHNEPDLIQALEKGVIWGAGLDVTNPEPMHPNNKLLQMENVAILPHIGSSTLHARNEMARLAAENIIEFYRSGKVPHQVF